MTFAVDSNLRQMMYAEWDAKSSADEATLNIRAKLDAKEITAQMVQRWFDHFDSDNSLRVINSTLLFSDDCRFKSKMLTDDGRLAFFPSCSYQKGSDFTVLDLFNGTKRTVKVNDELVDYRYGKVEMIDGDYFLVLNAVFDWLSLFKIDYETWTINLIDTVDNIQGNYFVVDQLDRSRFAIIAWDGITLGKVDKDRLVIGETVDTYFTQAPVGLKLEGSKLTTLCHENNFFWSNYGVRVQWKLCRFDLETQTKKFTNVKMNFEDGRPIDLFHRAFTWVGDRLYVANYVDPELTQNGLKCGRIQILVFDSKTDVWTDTGISVQGSSVCGMFIDWNNIMTLQVLDNGTYGFYRFPLTKPDTLQNLAFRVMFNRSKIYGNGKFSQFSDCLPYTCELRNLVPDEAADTKN